MLWGQCICKLLYVSAYADYHDVNACANYYEIHAYANYYEVNTYTKYYFDINAYANNVYYEVNLYADFSSVVEIFWNFCHWFVFYSNSDANPMWARFVFNLQKTHFILGYIVKLSESQWAMFPVAEIFLNEFCVLFLLLSFVEFEPIVCGTKLIVF